MILAGFIPHTNALILYSLDSPFLVQTILRLSKGDERAFEELYTHFSTKIYNISRKMRLGHEDAEGVVQEVFLRIWKNRDKLDPELSINAYMIAIVRSLVIKKAKKEARFFAFRQYQIPLLQPVVSSADHDLIYSEFHNMSLEILKKLPPGQRQIFKLRHLDNSSIEEIADQLNLSRRTVENQLFRGTKSFKEALAKLEIVSIGLWLITMKNVILSF